jgi:ABC-2 type transport system permease protein
VTALTIGAASLRRYLRDRTAMFFVVVLPVLVIVLVGATARGFNSFDVGVVVLDDGPLGEQLVDALERSPALEVHAFDDEQTAATAARRGEVSVAVVVPAGFDAALRRGDDQEVAVLGDLTDTNQQAAWSAVSSVVAEQAALVQAAHFTVERAGIAVDAALALAGDTRASTPSITVRETAVDTTAAFLPEGYSYSAPTMLVLFVFINSLAGGAAIIESRRLGMYERMSAAPVAARSIVAGETLCYLAMALLQSILIVEVGALVFGVDWGDPVAAAALVGSWALVGTGAGVLTGTLFRTAEQATAIGPPLGIAFGMLGGCMWPLEIVPSPMRTLGHVVPHGWAIDAWTVLLSRGGSALDIAGDLGVLLGFAAALLLLATTRLRRAVAA